MIRSLAFAMVLIALAGPTGAWAQAQAQPSPTAVAAASTDAEENKLYIRDLSSKLDAAVAYRKTSQAWNEAALKQAIREDDHFTFTLYKQAVTDVVLTILVIIIVGLGLWMSFLQINANLGATSLKISRDGLEMSSSVIGLFVLLASMFFFYIYIDKVYEIHQVSRGAQSMPPPAKAASSK